MNKSEWKKLAVEVHFNTRPNQNQLNYRTARIRVCRTNVYDGVESRESILWFTAQADLLSSLDLRWSSMITREDRIRWADEALQKLPVEWFEAFDIGHAYSAFYSCAVEEIRIEMGFTEKVAMLTDIAKARAKRREKGPASPCEVWALLEVLEDVGVTTIEFWPHDQNGDDSKAERGAIDRWLFSADVLEVRAAELVKQADFQRKAQADREARHQADLLRLEVQ